MSDNVYNIKPTKLVRGGDGYTGMCPKCQKRRRLGQAVSRRSIHGHEQLTTIWRFICPCGFTEEIGTNREVRARVAEEPAPAAFLDVD